jgi:hypothetical protein
MPNAVPCFSGANHLDVKPTPTGKVVPATPSSNPNKISCEKLVEKAIAMAGIAENTKRAAKTLRPP